MSPDNRDELLKAVQRFFDEARGVANLLINVYCERAQNSLSVSVPVDVAHQEGLLTVKEAAKLLRVSPRSIYDWAGQGKIPTRRVNGELRFLRHELLAWSEGRDWGSPDQKKQIRRPRLHVAE